MDLNPDALAVASARLARYKPSTHRASALEPFGLPANVFDSVGMSLLIHCLPGSLSSKAVIFDHARSVLARGGVVFGATLLNGASGIRPSRVARRRSTVAATSAISTTTSTIWTPPWAAPTASTSRIRGAVALFSARV